MLEYAILFLLLALTGFSFPLAEEAVLLFAAYFAASSRPEVVILTCVLGIAFADAVQYTRGRVKSRLFKQFKPGKQLIQHAGFFAVFTSRFFIASRTVLLYMAGAMQMPKFKFHIASLCSATVSTVVFVLIGMWIYSLIPADYAVAVWMVLLLLVNGVLVMYATRSQVKLARD